MYCTLVNNVLIQTCADSLHEAYTPLKTHINSQNMTVGTDEFHP